MIRYIPAEIITLYLTWTGPTTKPTGGTDTPDPIRWQVFVVMLWLTPVAVWITTAIKLKAAQLPLPFSPRSWPWWNALAAMVAFGSWVYALPESAFQGSPYYFPERAAAVLITVTIVLAMIGALVGPENS